MAEYYNNKSLAEYYYYYALANYYNIINCLADNNNNCLA